MGRGRLEAFSDGVLAIIITIMVLELKVPAQGDVAALVPLLPVFLSYVLSFVYLGIYWNNHHHMLQVTQHISGLILWANLHLMFWLSLIPFATAWMGENHFASAPTALYGGVLLLAAVGKDLKGKASPILYLLAILVAFVDRRLSQALYVLVALLWLIPDRRIERLVGERK